MAAGITKYAPINGMSDMKPHLSFLRTKKTAAFAYSFLFIFIACTIFIAFAPSSNSSSPWFTNIFSVGSSSNTPTDDSYRSQFSSSVYNYLFPNSTSRSPNNGTLLPFLNQTVANSTTQVEKQPQTQYDLQLDGKGGVLDQNQTTIGAKNSTLSANNTVNSSPVPTVATNDDKVGVLKQNQTTIGAKNSTFSANNTVNSSPEPVVAANDDKVGVLKQNLTTIGVANSTSPKPIVAQKGEEVKNLTSSLMKKQNGDGSNAEKGNQGSIDDLVKSLKNCDFFDGNWVTDNSYPLYKPGSCSLIDEQFNCFLNGRPDNGYHQLKWKPKGCTLPRLDGSHMLEMLRGKRLVFVGDSLNRNMWESLICILRNSVKDQKKVYEQSGRHHFRSEASYSFVFEDYKFTVEFFVSPFLVQEWEAADRNGKKKETLRLDLMGSYAHKYKTADVIVFNTGHWWTHEKTAKGKDYYQEGTHVYNDLNVQEAFRKALTTWGRWVDANVNPMKSLVFFRGYSASHFSGGQWNSGGQCDHETEPIKNETYLTNYPPKMTVLEKVLKGMKTSVTYLNITRMTDYRKDGHPSIYRKQHLTEQERRSPFSFQDCSHWCLPGVPDSWNEILYAELLVKFNRNH